MAERLLLAPRHRAAIEALLKEHLPGVEVWAYGSRVNGRAHDGSDLDLVLRASGLREIPDDRFADFKDALRDSNIPFLVEARDWVRLPETFHREIERDYVVLVGKEECRGGGDWPRLRLGDCMVINDSTYSPKEAWPFINYLDTGSITENQISEIQHLTVGKDKIPSRARRKVQPGDIVYSTVRPNQRHFGLLKRIPENFLASTGFSVLRGKAGVAYTNFLYWFLAQDRIVAQLHTIAEHSTSTYPSIRPADIRRLEVDLPPLPEQRAIAHVLGTLDDKIELNRRMNETLEAMARAIFRDWFVDFGPTRAKMEGRVPYLPHEIWELFPDALDHEGKPVDWAFSTLARLADPNPESWTAQNHPLTMEYVDLSNTKWGSIDSTTLMDWENAPSRARRIVMSGDTIVGTTRPGNGSFAYISRDGLTASTGFCVLSPRNENYRDAVYLAATSDENIERLTNLADGHGGAYPAARPSEVSDTPIVFPGDEVLALFADFVSPIRKKIEHTKTESRTFVRTRDLLLPKLISKEILIQNT